MGLGNEQGDWVCLCLLRRDELVQVFPAHATRHRRAHDEQGVVHHLDVLLDGPRAKLLAHHFHLELLHAAGLVCLDGLDLLGRLSLLGERGLLLALGVNIAKVLVHGSVKAIKCFVRHARVLGEQNGFEPGVKLGVRLAAAGLEQQISSALVEVIEPPVNLGRLDPYGGGKVLELVHVVQQRIVDGQVARQAGPADAVLDQVGSEAVHRARPSRERVFEVEGRRLFGFAAAAAPLLLLALLRPAGGSSLGGVLGRLSKRALLVLDLLHDRAQCGLQRVAAPFCHGERLCPN
mmetsp:Transcript_24297/g.77558  ORF Transcript_24297/g.77558 Transcript_24297/m.77558 type:complete len:291 (-) Transcript_24297:536-1408(-)